MINIALIGGIGSGKSALARYLVEKYRAEWIECDFIGHRLLDESDVQATLVSTFGRQICPEGRIDRKELGKIVFADKQELAKLNRILHPLIMHEVQQCQAEALHQNKPLCVLDGALLMDVGVDKLVDEIWAVQTDRQIRIRRLEKGRNLSPAEAEKIMERQISEEQYRMAAHRVINLDNGIEGAADHIKEALYQIGLKDRNQKKDV